MFGVEWGSGFRDGDAPKGRQGSAVSNTEGTAVVHIWNAVASLESLTRELASVDLSNPNTVLNDLQMKM